MNKERRYLIPLILFAFSFFLRISLISKGPYHVDCFDLAMQSQATLDTFQLHYLYGSGYPFTVVLGAFFIFLLKPFGLGDPVFAVNFMSVVFGSLCIPALYTVSRKLTNEIAALFSALMFSVIPVFLGVSVYGKNHTPSLFFLLISINFLLRYAERKNIRDIIFGGISIGLFGATRSQDLVLMLPALCYIYFYSPVAPDRLSVEKNRKKTLQHFFLLWSLAGIIVLGMHLPLLLQKHDTYYKVQLAEFWESGLIQNFLWIDATMLRWSLYLTETNFTWGGLVLAAIGLIAISFKNKRAFLFLALWFIVPMLFYANLRTTVERFLIIGYIPLLIGQGYILEKLRKISQLINYVMIAVFVTIMIFLLADITPILRYRHEHDHLTEYAQWVGTQSEANAVIIVGDENVFIQHYAKRQTQSHLISMFNPISEEQFAEYKKTLDKYFQEGRTVYITGLGLWSYNIDKVFYKLLSSHYELKFIGQRPFQDWHHGETYHQVFNMDLYQLIPKQ